MPNEKPRSKEMIDESQYRDWAHVVIMIVEAIPKASKVYEIMP